MWRPLYDRPGVWLFGFRPKSEGAGLDYGLYARSVCYVQRHCSCSCGLWRYISVICLCLTLNRPTSFIIVIIIIIIIIAVLLDVVWWWLCVVRLVSGHAAVAERLHARHWNGNVRRVSVSSVCRNDFSRSRRVSWPSICVVCRLYSLSQSVNQSINQNFRHYLHARLGPL